MKREGVAVEQRKFALCVFGFFVAAAIFALGYFAGINAQQPQIQISAVEVQNAAPVVTAVPQEQDTGLVDLNTADQAALETLPGVGPVLAERILAYRSENGLFIAKEQLMDVEGIGEVRYAELEDMITVEVEYENSGS